MIKSKEGLYFRNFCVISFLNVLKKSGSSGIINMMVEIHNGQEMMKKINKNIYYRQ
ncbi:hypothetical protein HMPREF3182_01031 [Megasphaera hutchinsoni]|uniref:Uncharacterized protein n=1 Tax=Megasphaera hutchinsoni TaxID=1588748 RepID=A0A134CEJ3_9FIRM|nr:hypothetical protein HMPREF3182_01031 [Megasphaera hutchinsoni]